MFSARALFSSRTSTWCDARYRLLRRLSAVDEEGFGHIVSGKDKLDAKLVERHFARCSESGHHRHGLDQLASNPKGRTDHQVGARAFCLSGDVFSVGLRSSQQLLAALFGA